MCLIIYSFCLFDNLFLCGGCVSRKMGQCLGEINGEEEREGEKEGWGICGGMLVGLGGFLGKGESN